MALRLPNAHERTSDPLTFVSTDIATLRADSFLQLFDCVFPLKDGRRYLRVLLGTLCSVWFLSLWRCALVVYPPKKAKNSETEPARKAKESRPMSVCNEHVMTVLSSSLIARC